MFAGNQRSCPENLRRGPARVHLGRRPSAAASATTAILAPVSPEGKDNSILSPACQKSNAGAVSGGCSRMSCSLLSVVLLNY